MNTKSRIIALLLAIFTIVSILPISAITTLAAQVATTDAMTAIESEFSQYKKGQTLNVSNDGYLNIPVEVSVYHKGTTVKNGEAHSATPVVIYVVNTMLERIGTDSDTEIITSMLDRGYIVVIFDYLNNAKAISPDLDWSVQKLRAKVTDGTYFSGLDGFPSGKYYNNMVVPAGYNIEFDHVFWEIDKYGADGTFEKIIEVWNNDFRSWKGERLVKWVDQNGNRKATQNGHDESAPVWLDINGNADPNGQYVKIKHTLVTKIEECVQHDGTPIDLNLYMHITYPTNPANEVPVMTLSNSSGHLAKGTQAEDRPHFIGFLFNGYATVTFDYGYTPMARDDHYGYFDGSTPASGSVTGDNVTYSIHWYNESKIDTAAMRYIRYLSASNHNKYSFKDDAIGVYGNSKGGWATLLGEEHPEDLPERRIYPGCSGASRYEEGKTEDIIFGSYVIDGGEEQPWRTYGGNTLDSGADFIYSSCGGGSEQISAEHCPMFISCNLGDGSYYSSSNQFVNVCRNMNVPAMWFEVGQGHTFASERDLNYGVSTYEALFLFANYYLRGDAVQVVYAARDAAYSGMPSNAPIVVKFNGAVSESEVSKITLKDSKGNTVSGKWTSQFGDTEWTFTTPTLKCDEEYTMSVPAGIKGDNGKGMAQEYVYNFRTGYEKASAVISKSTSKGTYFYFTVPDKSTVTEFDVDLYSLRLNVTNDAVNKLEIYPLTGFNASTPDSATVGALLQSIPVSGAGQYDVSLTETISKMSVGTTAAFLVKQVKTPGQTVVSNSTLESSVGNMSISSDITTTFATTPDGKPALKVTAVKSDVSKYVNDVYSSNPMTFMTNNKIIKNGNLVESDIGRRFKISLSVYDTTSRIITLRMTTLSNQSKQFADYNAYFLNFYTKANEWVDFEFEYTVYEPLYADQRGYITQSLNIITVQWGADNPEIYFKDIKSTEIVTDVTFGDAELLMSTTMQRVDPLETEYGSIPGIYENVDEYPYVLLDSKGDCIAAGSTLITDAGGGVLGKIQDSEAPFNYSDHVLLVRKNMTHETNYNNLSFIHGDVIIDLLGNTLECTGYLFNATAKRSSTTNITVKNGTLLQKSNPLVLIDSTSTPNYNYQQDGVKQFNFVFDNVTFGYSVGATAVPFIKNDDNAPVPVKATFSLINCKFDLKTNAPSGSYTLLKLNADSSSNIKTEMTVKGGVIKANSFAGITIASFGGENTFKFSKDAYGNYTTVELPAGSEAPSGSYTADGKGVMFEEDSTENGITVFKLGVNPCETPYGTIPEQYRSVADYPFVSFKDNGDGTYTFRKAEKNIFLDASSLMSDIRDVKAVVYLRTDYSTSNQFNNFGFCKDNTFDLGGNTLEFLSGNPMQCKKEWDKNIVFKNGTIVVDAGALLSISGASSGAGYGFYFTFEDITFKRAAGSTAKTPLIKFNNTDISFSTSITFNNCIFDMSGSLPGEGLTLFAAGDPQDKCAATVNVNGGRIIFDVDKGFTLIGTVKEKSSVVFGKYNDKYTELVLPSSANPSLKVDSAQGQMIFALTSSVNSVDTYSLVPIADATTKYGDIPYKYASKEYYPFVQFKIVGDSYQFLAADKDIFEDASSLMYTARSVNTVILLRSDVARTGTHSNLCHISGTLIIDLGGHTIDSSSGIGFSANVKKNVIISTVIFKNGTVIVKNNPFMTFASTFDSDKDGTHTFNITFDNIKFEYATSSSSKYLVAQFNNGIRPYNVNLTYNNCTFDLANAPNTAILFESGSSDEKVAANVVVNGGTVLNAKLNMLDFVKSNNSSSSVKFGKYEGSYIKLSSSSGTLASETFESVGGTALTFASNGILVEVGGCTHTNLGTWQSNGTQHWIVCSDCQTELQKANCSGGEATCTAKAVCSVCSTTYGTVNANNHAPSSNWTSENGKHYKTCNNGCQTKLLEADCSGGEATCTAKAICSVCSTAYGTVNASNHTGLGSWQSNDTQHWKKCSDCQSETAKGNHYDNNSDGNCDLCNKVVQAPPCLHTNLGTWQSNGTQHWIVCSDCQTELQKANCSGGEATCTAKAVCTVCSTTYGTVNANNHSPSSNWTSENGKHYKTCNNGCQTKLQEADCSGGETTCTAKAVCSVCSTAYGTVNANNHAPSSNWTSENGKHYKTCNNGCQVKLSETNCFGGVATCTAKAICSVCSTAYGTVNANNHAPSSNWTNENGKHYKTCNNGCQTKLLEADCSGGEATCTAKAVCSVCSTAYGTVNASNHAPSSNWTSENGKHYKTCNNGCQEKIEEAVCSGGEATCEEKAKCQICSNEYGEKSDEHSYDNSCDTECNVCHVQRDVQHTYSSEWKNTDDKHWHECTCGGKKDEAQHEFGDWITDGDERIRSCECGYEETRSLPKSNTSIIPIIVVVVIVVVILSGAGFCAYYFLLRKNKR